MKLPAFPYAFIIILLLTACGGGGGSGSSSSISQSSGGSGSSSSSTPSSYQVVLSQAQITPTTILATTTQTTNVAYLFLDKVYNSAHKFLNMVMPNAYAVTGCGILCSPSYPPVSASATQQITQQLLNGSLVPLSLVFNPAPSTTTTIPCDFTNAGIQVNNLWLLDNSTNNALASLTVPVSADNSCKLTYATNDYLILANGNVYQLNQNITGTITDIIPANDPDFNTSPNTLLISGSMVSELSISNTTGQVTLTQLTTASAPVRTYMGAITYDGNHLIGVSSTFPGWVVYTKGSTSFQIIRDNTGGGYGSVFQYDAGKFVLNYVYIFYTVDPVTLTQTPWTPSTQAHAMYGANGRYQTYLMSDRCVLWDYSNGNWSNLNFYPQYLNQDPWGPTAAAGSPSYSRLLSNGKAYCVTGQLNGFARYDVSTSTGTGFDLDTAGYLASSYKLFSNVAYATVTNTSNSNVEYIQMNFDTGVLTYLGTITSGTRQVVSLVKMGGT
jgi:hypothetical protein